jgi:uncharacterized protein YfdQ (DUF2303 family)
MSKYQSEVTDQTDIVPDVKLAMDAAVAATESEDLLDDGSLKRLVVPEGYDSSVLDLDDYAHQPRTLTGDVAPFTLDELIKYVKRHDDPAQTTIWLRPKEQSVVAVIDDHEGFSSTAEQRQNHGRHRAHLKLLQTPEWAKLQSVNEEQMSQLAFAELIEDLAHVVFEPDAADLFEIAQTFHAHKDASFSQIQRLRDGTISVGYHEDLTASAGNESGKIEIPNIIVFKVAPFEGEEPTSLQALLRYRLNGPKLTLGIKLVQPEEVIRLVLEQMQEKLGNEFGEDRVFLGSPR